MSRKNRSPEEKARRAKIPELLQIANIDSMDDIQNLFKETIAEFMENGLEAMRILATANTTTRTRLRTTAGMATAVKICGPVLAMSRFLFPVTGRVNLNRSKSHREALPYRFLRYPASSRYSGWSFRYGSLSPQMV